MEICAKTRQISSKLFDECNNKWPLLIEYCERNELKIAFHGRY